MSGKRLILGALIVISAGIVIPNPMAAMGNIILALVYIVIYLIIISIGGGKVF
ncbi:MAG: hypothetical protein KAH32_07970 [Chlamydiia bacterium]|nr:hypothetical protein [Chlamydiia bacterium]